MMTVIRSSESDNWKDAVVEWDIDDCEEDLSCSSECVCGKENISSAVQALFDIEPHKIRIMKKQMN